jgi:2-hydroxychromene-2-carboxylate isomerase
VGAALRSGEVEFWFDPSCPFTHQTSLWLREVADRQGLSVRWRLMSLAVLNEGRAASPEREERFRQAGRVLRVLAAAEEHGGNDAVGRLYEVLSRARHEDGTPLGQAVLEKAVHEVGLPSEIAAAADQDGYDAVVRASHQEGQRRIGTEAGSPILALAGGRGFFGPVVAPAPTGKEADRLLEAFRLLDSVPSFSELKTARSAL